MMDINLLRNKNIYDLRMKLYSISKEYLYLRMKLKSKKLKKTHLLRLYRKKIAVIKTVINEKVLRHE